MSVVSPPSGAVIQPALWSVEEPVALEPALKRVELGNAAWVDTMTGFVRGGDTLLNTLVATVHLMAERRPMYENMVDVPRLSAHLPTDHLESTVPVIGDIAALLGARYRKAFTRVGINLYRNERDSVAWHADKIGRVMHQPIVGLVSLGAARPFLLRPLGGGRSRRFVLGSGDLLVMGGTCQHRFEHAVPKLTLPTTPRLSLTFRHDD
ncbi:MAG: alpha-ketoglutarate-dependent dioxygenase AlkB [bacterium]|nr:alpha-ketoglutarate-dependent dioxygenase AlkB [bacterium]MCY3890537.1 alpha-ketoglutarate-dependent dioxygenase AlkB [bacterium]MCY3960551.1 alpha-ketoglutarate-dependent dioxygenase AlkB [bacterium]MCY4136223.1 alpha-ketoglutarate-dependent dioxygenase AlkB [bacterium]